MAEGDQSIVPDQSDTSITTNSNANITKSIIKCKDSLEHIQNANSNHEKTSDCTKLSDFKGSKVLNSLKMSLEGTLNCVNFIRQRVHENILAKTNEKNNFKCLFEKPMYHCSNDIDLKSANIPKDNSLCHIDEITNDSNLINKENEQTTTDKINSNSNEVINKNVTDYSILGTFSEKEIKSINQPNSLSGINCTSQEQLTMISLLSEDEDLETDSTNISGSCIDSGNNKTSLTSQEEHSVNIESNLNPAQNEIRAEKNGLNEVNHPQSSKAQGKILGEFGKQNVKKKKNDSGCNKISGLHLDSISDSAISLTSQEECPRIADNNIAFVQNECREEKNDLNGNQQKTVEKRSKSPEKRSDELNRQHIKKKRIVEVNRISCQPKGFDFCGVFYKVKLTNLHPRINYGHIASLLRKADLDFVDILLVNSGSYRSFAEISFTDSAAREFFVYTILGRSDMFGAMKPFSKQTGAYQEIIQSLSEACSEDLDSLGLKLLEETADSIKIAIDKLTELEKFISEHRSVPSDGKAIAEKLEMRPVKLDASKEDLEQKTEDIDMILKTYFTINENVAECHLIEAFQKEGFYNFHLNLLVNKVNYAYGFITFDNEETLMNALSLSTKIRIGNSVLKIVPRCKNVCKELKEQLKKLEKRGKKRKRKNL